MSRFEKMLEKAGILTPETPEVKETVNTSNVSAVPNTSMNQQAEVSGNVELTADIIAEAYSTLPQTEDNIYIVEELLKNFNMLPDESKHTVVRSTLTTMQKDIDEFLAEAQNRKAALVATFESYTNKATQEMTELTATIEAAEKDLETMLHHQFSTSTK